MVSVVVSSVVDCGLSFDQLNPKTIKLGRVVSPISSQD
jgi:hypothetical protein